jgi:hypothetical protein
MEDNIDVLNKKIELIQERILLGKIRLLDLELVPLFNELKDTLTINNLETSSEIYKKTCNLLDQKFEELKVLLSSLESNEKFLNYLKSEPSDSELYDLMLSCWNDVFLIDSLSIDFMALSQKKLFKERISYKIVENLKRIKVKDQFLVEVPKQRFTEKMMNYYNSIQNKLPCQFDELFEDEITQDKIYEKFVLLLHLLQLGKIKYQKETNTLYL